LFKRGYFVTSLEQDLIIFFSKQDKELLKELTIRERIEKFIYGVSFTAGLVKTDAREKPFFIQQFIHHFKLELFWAIFPTLKCIAI